MYCKFTIVYYSCILMLWQCIISELLCVNILLRIINILLAREFHSPKSQFVKYQCLCITYFQYANFTVLSRNLQNVNVCVLSCIINVFSREREGSLTAKSHYFQISDHRQRTPENWSESTRFHAVRPQLPRIMQNSLNPHPWPAI